MRMRVWLRLDRGMRPKTQMNQRFARTIPLVLVLEGSLPAVMHDQFCRIAPDELSDRSERHIGR